MLQESKSVTVGVRIRPRLDGVVNALQSAERYEQMACSQLSEKTLRLWDGRATRDSRTFFFGYDSVFDENTTQEEIYEELVTSAVDLVLSGTNVTVLTYGQTGSGKTYTVLGGIRKSPMSDDIITDETGILLRSLQDILHFAEINKNNRHIIIGISAVEIYLDEVRDLLSDEQAPTVIQMAVMKDIVRFPKLTCLPILSLHDGLKVFQKATSKRAQRMTSANDTSSRSHAVFNIEVFQQPITPISRRPMRFLDVLSLRDLEQLNQLEGKTPKLRSHDLFRSASNSLFGPPEAPIMYSKLVLADLAGSEKARNSSVKGEGFDELKKINASLTSLGNVVHCLHEGSRHIPYRDSKLTTVLRDSFAAPNARVVLIVNVSPTVLTVDETLSTLYFADKVKMVKTGPSSGSGSFGSNEMVYEYLSSLRKHDELTSDLRIASVLHRFKAPQVIPVVAGDPKNVLYDFIFRIRRPKSDIQQMAISTLCDAFKTSLDGGRNWILEQEQENQMVRRTVRDETVMGWKKRRSELHDLINGITGSINSNGITDEEIWNKRLEEAASDLGEARARRRSIQVEYNTAVNGLKQVENKLSSVREELKQIMQSNENGTRVDKNEDDTVLLWRQEQREEACWERFSTQAIQAVESAKLRFELSKLICETHRLAVEMKKEKRLVTNKQSQAVYEWLRHVVWGMAGNAVVISNRKEKRRQRKISAADADEVLVDGYIAPHPRQYWQQKPSEENRQRKKRKRSTRYDDDTLREEVISFVKMGGEVLKYSRDGTTHRRLLYIENKDGEDRLCWSTLGSLSRDGYIPLRSITHLQIGRATGDIKNASDIAVAQFYLSWGVVYKRRGSSTTVEFACDTVTEMEAWVIGLSYLTNLVPAFAVLMGKHTPNTSKTNKTDTGSTGSSDNTDENGWGALSSTEAAFCHEWHVPPLVYAETRRQLMKRRTGKRLAGLRLSPGELRSLVKLDIFRASAMWLRFQAEGLVTKPKGKLYCYVQAPAIQDTASMGANPTTGDDSDEEVA
ncbi:kinesin [Trypanosoma theileri]|uniref:Kinesin n=1 Tax=Trypanosoma theileri TaxID=67003 RepID=A0A1X0NYU1_9TRYP|nr:kinesin [Trypanosoma theileri]ORC89845.1 kinesin [Trypanosoma theileri]